MKQTIAGIVVVLILTIAAATGLQSDSEADRSDEASVEVAGRSKQLVQSGPLELEVTLIQHYMDGNTEEKTHKETVWSMEDFWSYYGDWQLVRQQNGEVVFKKEVADISPYMKENGYFGLNGGQLTIFEGRPMEEQVIQSFYQIDTSELKSYQAKQLQDGIKIDSKQTYQYVLEVYRSMAPSRSVSS